MRIHPTEAALDLSQVVPNQRSTGEIIVVMLNMKVLPNVDEN